MPVSPKVFKKMLFTPYLRPRSSLWKYVVAHSVKIGFAKVWIPSSLINLKFEGFQWCEKQNELHWVTLCLFGCLLYVVKRGPSFFFSCVECCNTILLRRSRIVVRSKKVPLTFHQRLGGFGALRQTQIHSSLCLPKHALTTIRGGMVS